MQIEKRIGREKKRCGYAPFNSAQQAIKLRSLRSLRPSGKLPSATCFIAGPLGAMLGELEWRGAAVRGGISRKELFGVDKNISESKSMAN